jgi:hypothetical protein
MSKPAIVLSANEWNPSAIRYAPPKISDRGAKTINIISSQNGRWLNVSTPLMMTWGVADFVDEKTGESDGKFSMTLNFPNAEYSNASTNEFLAKVKAFENQILDDAVKYSEVWFGEEMSREVAKHTFFPVLKYPKDKTTKKSDLTKAPSMRVKVPNYNNKWNIEIYDTKNTRIFPNESSDCVTPMDLIPSKSKVACIIQCSGLWFGGKGWGVTWKLSQCVVKPQEVLSVFGKCHIQLSNDDLQTIENQSNTAEDSGLVEEEEPDVPATQPVSTEVEDSDAEEAEAEPEPVKAAPVKKIVKKVVPAVEQPVAVEEAPVAAAAPKKKVVKKVAA